MEVSPANLRTAEIFTALTELQREEVALGASFSRREAGEYIFHSGETSDFLFLISEGRVGLYADAHDGVLHPVSMLSNGQVLGLSALFPVASWELTARAMATTTLIVIPRRWLLSHMIGDPDLELRILQGVMEIVRRRFLELINTITGTEGASARSGSSVPRYEAPAAWPAPPPTVPGHEP